MVKPIYPREAAALLSVHVQTLQRWDREGILVANRTATNRRYYTIDQLEAHMSPPKAEVPRG